MTFRFTKATIDQLPVPTQAEAGSAGCAMYWDAVVTGFGVLIRPSGLRTFILVYRNKEGRVKRLTIGRYGRITVDQAREAAKKHNGNIVLGGDPLADKKKNYSAKTIDEVLGEYLDRHIIPSGSRHALRSVERVRKLIKKSLGAKHIHLTESADVRECLELFQNQKGNYNLILTYVRAAWNWAREHRVGLTKHDTQNPATGVEPKASTPQAREVLPVEYSAVFDAIEELMAERRNDPARLLACLFVIRTGCRPIEAIRLRRDKVFRLRGRAELHEHKTFKRTGIPKVFFLTPRVLDIVSRAEALHILRGVKSDYVFPRRAKATASNWLAKTWNSIRKRANVDLELRHFRSGYINMADEAGLEEHRIAEVTQHTSPQTIRRHYRIIKMKRAGVNANDIEEMMERQRKGVLDATGQSKGVSASKSDVTGAGQG